MRESPPVLGGRPAPPEQASPAPRTEPTGPRTEPTRPRTEPATPPRRTRGGIILLPPWTRAPLRSFRHPAVLLAVAGAAVILTCASSSAAWFLSSASSASLQKMVAANCPDFAYPRATLRGGGDAG